MLGRDGDEGDPLIQVSDGGLSRTPEGRSTLIVRLPPAYRLTLAGRILVDSLRIRLQLRRSRLPDLVRQLSRPGWERRQVEPRRLGHLVYRVMNLGPLQPRCLLMSLVLLRALHRQRTSAELVVGLPLEAQSHFAHAWVEVDGHDVGPPPGRLDHAELARFGATSDTDVTG